MTTFKSDDDRNPIFALQTVSTEILAAAARGEIDLNALAKQELASRGLDFNGTWVGFERAKVQVPSYEIRKQMREATLRVGR